MQMEYEISEQDFLDAQKLAIRSHPSHYARLVYRGLPYIGGGVILVALWLLCLDGLSTTYFLPLALGVTCLLMPTISKQAQKKLYRKNSNLHGPRTMVLDEQGLNFSCPTFSSKLKWPFFLKYVEDDKTFVLFQSNQIFHLIPKRQLSPQEISGLREAFKQHISGKS